MQKTINLLLRKNKILLNKRGIVESVNNFKNWANIEHSRHRSPNNFFVNLMTGIVAYCWQLHKPTVKLAEQEIALLAGQQLALA